MGIFHIFGEGWEGVIFGVADLPRCEVPYGEMKSEGGQKRFFFGQQWPELWDL